MNHLNYNSENNIPFEQNENFDRDITNEDFNPTGSVIEEENSHDDYNFYPDSGF